MKNMLFLVLVVCMGCKTNAPKNVSHVQKHKRYELLLHFRSLGDLKRIIHQFDNLKMQELNTVTEQPVQRIVSVECAEYAIDGVVLKLEQQDGVISATRYP